MPGSEIKRALVAAAFALALVALAATAPPESGLHQALAAQQPRVPALVGLPVDRAAKILDRMKVRYDTSLRVASSQPYNSVVRQAPDSGTPIRPGMVVRLALSSGSEAAAANSVMVPDVTGRDTDQAALALRHAGLAEGRVDVIASETGIGLVIRQVPPAGSKVPHGTVVALQVAGPPARVAVPPVTGLPESKAVRIIETAGLHAAPITHSPDPAGNHQVVAERPEAGTLVAQGSAVALEVAVPPAPPARVMVPHVEGRTPAEAVAILENVELHVGNVAVVETTTTANRVLHQLPQPDQVVDTGTEVSLTVSKPLRRDTVPDVLHQRKATAESTLAARHFTLTVSDTTSDRADSGRVLEQDPPGGTEVSPGSEVALVVGLYLPTPLWLKLFVAVGGIGGGVYGLVRIRQWMKDRPWRGRMAMTPRSDPEPPGRIDTDHLLSRPELGLAPRASPINVETADDEPVIEGES